MRKYSKILHIYSHCTEVHESVTYLLTAHRGIPKCFIFAYCTRKYSKVLNISYLMYPKRYQCVIYLYTIKYLTVLYVCILENSKMMYIYILYVEVPQSVLYLYNCT